LKDQLTAAVINEIHENTVCRTFCLFFVNPFLELSVSIKE
jgi:hypothetical protein